MEDMSNLYALGERCLRDAGHLFCANRSPNASRTTPPRLLPTYSIPHPPPPKKKESLKMKTQRCGMIGGRGRAVAEVDAGIRGGEVRRPGHATSEQRDGSERLGSRQLTGDPGKIDAPT